MNHFTNLQRNLFANLFLFLFLILYMLVLAFLKLRETLLAKSNQRASMGSVPCLG